MSDRDPFDSAADEVFGGSASTATADPFESAAAEVFSNPTIKDRVRQQRDTTRANLEGRALSDFNASQFATDDTYAEKVMAEREKFPGGTIGGIQPDHAGPTGMAGFARNVGRSVAPYAKPLGGDIAQAARGIMDAPAGEGKGGFAGDVVGMGLQMGATLVPGAQPAILAAMTANTVDQTFQQTGDPVAALGMGAIMEVANRTGLKFAGKLGEGVAAKLGQAIIKDGGTIGRGSKAMLSYIAGGATDGATRAAIMSLGGEGVMTATGNQTAEQAMENLVNNGPKAVLIGTLGGMASRTVGVGQIAYGAYKNTYPGQPAVAPGKKAVENEASPVTPRLAGQSAPESSTAIQPTPKTPPPGQPTKKAPRAAVTRQPNTPADPQTEAVNQAQALIDQYVRDGMSPTAARIKAVGKVGPMAVVPETPAPGMVPAPEATGEVAIPPTQGATNGQGQEGQEVQQGLLTPSAPAEPAPVASTSAGAEPPVESRFKLADAMPGDTVKVDGKTYTVERSAETGQGRGMVLRGESGKREFHPRTKPAELVTRPEADDASVYPDTPEPIADRMALLANIQPGEVVLDPQIGRGAITKAAHDSQPKAEFHGIEIDGPTLEQMPQDVRGRLASLNQGDFLTGQMPSTVSGVKAPHVVITTPPWDQNPLAHVQRAFQAVRPGGRVVAFVPADLAVNLKLQGGSLIPGAEVGQIHHIDPSESLPGQPDGSIVTLTKPDAKPAESAKVAETRAKAKAKQAATAQTPAAPAPQAVSPAPAAGTTPADTGQSAASPSVPAVPGSTGASASVSAVKPKGYLGRFEQNLASVPTGFAPYISIKRVGHSGAPLIEAYSLDGKRIAEANMYGGPRSIAGILNRRKDKYVDLAPGGILEEYTIGHDFTVENYRAKLKAGDESRGVHHDHPSPKAPEPASPITKGIEATKARAVEKAASSIDKAREVAYEKRKADVLDVDIRSRDHGVVTRQQLIDREMEAGKYPSIVDITDTAAVNAATQKKQVMDRSSDWVPTGNPNHPRTIEYNRLKEIIANPPKKPEYRMVDSDGQGWRVLTKIEYDYAAERKNQPAKPAETGGKVAGDTIGEKESKNEVQDQANSPRRDEPGSQPVLSGEPRQPAGNRSGSIGEPAQDQAVDAAPSDSGESGRTGGGKGIKQGRKPRAGGGSGASGGSLFKPTGESSPGETGTVEQGGGSVPARPAKPAKDVSHRNHRIADDDQLIVRGLVGKFEANIAAIKLLKKLEAENRYPTPDEAKTMAKFVGWGALSQYLDRVKLHRIDEMKKSYDESAEGGYYKNKYKNADEYVAEYADEETKKWMEKYGERAVQLRAMLTTDEWNTAAASTRNAHYTSREVITNGLWAIVERLGFKGGRILENSAGIGHVIGLTPSAIADQSDWLAVDMDELSTRFLKKLYPQAKVFNSGFQDTPIADNSVDLVIGNVPFAADGPSDKKYPSFSLHNYMLAKSLDVVRPGGFVVEITSNSTMDAPISSKFREWANNKADLVAAIRLPNDAFSDNAGTEVTTDILVFRKRDAKPIENRNAWIGLASIDSSGGEEGSPKTIDVNEYYRDHPEMMLGKMGYFGTMWRSGQSALIAPEGQDLSKALQGAVSKLPANIADGSKTEVREPEPTEKAIGKEYSYNVGEDGRVGQSIKGFLKIPSWATAKNAAKRFELARDLIGVRDLLKKHIYDQLGEDASESVIDKQRAELGKKYDAFVKKHGRINDTLARSTFAEDPEYPLLSSLELIERNVVESTSARGKVTRRIVPTFAKADIFTKRVIFPTSIPDKADNAVDASNISMAWKGLLDAEYVAELLSTTKDDAEKKLIEAGVAFKNPDTGLVEHQDDYLSGNVVKKLAQAEQASKDDETYKPNIEALKAVQPKKRGIGSIRFDLGTSWVPAEAYADWFKSVLEVDNIGTIDEVTSTSGWNPRWSSQAVRSANNTAKGAGGLEFTELVTPIMQRKMPVAYDTVSDDQGRPKQVKNQERTIQAQARATELRAEFEEWAKKSVHAPAIADKYHELFGSSIKRTFTALPFGHFPGQNKAYHAPRPHQNRAIVRGIRESYLLAHEVGVGKTITFLTTAMEWRRLGLAKKVMIVAFNANCEQIVETAKRMYPQAKILAPTSKDFEAANRKRFISRVATSDFDIIILPHSQFNRIPDDLARVSGWLNDQIAELVAEMSKKGFKESKKGARNVDPTQKRIEEAIARLRKILEKILKRPMDDTLTFEQLGIDGLIVDEAHFFKKVYFNTEMDRVKGLDTTASQRGISLLMKLRNVQAKTNNRNIILATGTPITNTLAEAWNMMRLVRPDLMEEHGMRNFDAFASTFTSAESVPEMDVTGRWKTVTRLSRFTNGPALAQIFATTADVVFARDVPGIKLPKHKGGAPAESAIPLKGQLLDYNRELMARYEAFEAMEPRERREHSYIPIVIGTLARKSALDMRMVDPSIVPDSDQKIDRVVENAMKVYAESMDNLGTQIIVADLYQSSKQSKDADDKAAKGEFGDVDDAESKGEEEEVAVEADAPDMVGRFNLFREIKRMLVARGIPENEIVIITDISTTSDTGKAMRLQAFAKMNSGEVRFILGTTDRLGVGVNMQERAVAIHHMDAPYRPADYSQRNGRIFRDGNTNDLVYEFRYGVDRTADAGAYQRLAKKQTFIDQILTGTLDDIEGESPTEESVMSYQEAAAVFSGDPNTRKRFELQAKIDKLRIVKKGHENHIESLNRQMVRNIADNRARTSKIAAVGRWLETYGDLSLDKAVFEYEGVKHIGPKALEEAMKGDIADASRNSERKWEADGEDSRSRMLYASSVGQFAVAGFVFKVETIIDSDSHGVPKTSVPAKRLSCIASPEGRDLTYWQDDAVGLSTVLGHMFSRIGPESAKSALARYREEITAANNQNTDYEAETAKPWPKKDELDATIAELAQIVAANDSTVKPKNTPGSSGGGSLPNPGPSARGMVYIPSLRPLIDNAITSRIRSATITSASAIADMAERIGSQAQNRLRRIGDRVLAEVPKLEERADAATKAANDYLDRALNARGNPNDWKRWMKLAEREETNEKNARDTANYKRRSGKFIKEVAASLVKIARDTEAFAAADIHAALPVLRKLTNAQKIVVGKMAYYGPASPEAGNPSQAEIDAYEAVLEVMDNGKAGLSNFGQMGGTRVLPSGRRVTPKGSGKWMPTQLNALGKQMLRDDAASKRDGTKLVAIAQKMVDRGYVNSIDEGITAIRASVDENTTRTPNAYFEKSRTPLPVEILDFNPIPVLPGQIRKNSLVIAAGTHLGGFAEANQYPKLTQLYDALDTAPGADVADWKAYFDAELGGAQSGNAATRAITGAILSLQYWTKIAVNPFSIWRNMAQPLVAMADYPIGARLMGNFIDYPPFIGDLTKRGRATKLRAELAGSVPVQSAAADHLDAGKGHLSMLMAGLSPFARSQVGTHVRADATNRRATDSWLADMTALEKPGMGLRKIAAIVQQFDARSLASPVKTAKANIAEKLERIGITSAKLANMVAAGQRLTPEELDAAAFLASHDTQFAMTIASKPLWWNRLLTMRVFYQFKNFTVRMSRLVLDRFIKPAMRGHLYPIASLIVSAAVTMESVRYVQDVATGQDRSATSALLNPAQKDQYQEAAKRALKNAGYAGIFGPVVEASQGVVDWALGPSVGTFYDGLSAVVDTLKGASPKLVAADLAKKQAPVIGTTQAIAKNIAGTAKSMNEVFEVRRMVDAYLASVKIQGAAEDLADLIDQAAHGTPQMKRGGDYLARREAAKLIGSGDATKAGIVLGEALKDTPREQMKKKISSVKAGLVDRGPLGKLPKDHVGRFLNTLSPEDRAKVIEVRRKYLVGVNEAIQGWLKAWHEVHD